MIENRALNILESYSGANNYILRLKTQKRRGKSNEKTEKITQK